MRIREGFPGQRSLVLPKIIVDIMSSDPVASVLYITDIGYYPSAANHFMERTEPINEFVLIYCMRGKGWFDCKGKQHEVGANTYFILPPGASHSYGSDDQHPWSIYWIHFNGTLAPFYASECGVPHSIIPGITSRIETRTNLFEEIFDALCAGYNIDNIRYAMSLFHHFLGTLRYLGEYRNGGKNTQDLDIVNAAIHYMNENIEQNLSLANLSDFIGFSPSYLSSVFKTRTGHSPMSYFQLLKIRRACKLLDETEMKVNNICHKVGISDPYYFSRLFSKIMGISPTAYRNRQPQ